MKPLFALLVLASTCAAARAQEAPAAETTRTKFYDFGELDVTGAKVKPSAEWVSARQRAVFDRLFALRRSLLPELQQTARPAEAPAAPEAP